MRKHLLLFFPLFFFLVSPLIVTGHAYDYELDLLAIPQGVADRFSIPLFAGQLITWMFFYLILIGFTYAIQRKFGMIGLTLSLAWVSIGVVISWMPVYIMVVLCLLVAVLYASKVKRWMS